MAVFYLSLSSLYFVTTRWLSSASGDCKGSVLFFSWLQIKKWLNIKRVFTGLIQKTRGWLSASGHCAGPSRSWGSFFHYIRSCEEWERWTQIAARCVSPTINQLSFKPNNITSLRLSLPQDYDNRSYMICSPSPQRKSNKRGCFGGKRRQTADHTEKGKILAQKNGGTRSNREKKKPTKTLMCHLQVLCGQVMEQWDTKQEMRERDISAFVPLLLAQCILDQFTQFF